jgi:MYXO-CTERM domain-containing protein
MLSSPLAKTATLALVTGLFLAAAPALADTKSCSGQMADGQCDAANEPCTCDDCASMPTCGGCVNDGKCDPQQDACTCPDCHGDPPCASQCTDDGFCVQYMEGCACADCKSSVPNCTDTPTGSGGSGGSGGGAGGSGGKSGGGCASAPGGAGGAGALLLAALGAAFGLARSRRGARQKPGATFGDEG